MMTTDFRPTDFKPAWWSRGAHAQTIFGRLLKPLPKLSLRRKRLELPDGDFLDVDFLENTLSETSVNVSHDTPLVVIMHGLEGSSRAPYVQSLLGEIFRRRWLAAAVNMRMCSGEPNRLRETYHSGKSEDLEFVVEHLRRDMGFNRIYLVGFSIGGNIALKWLGEQGAGACGKIEKAAAVSVPYDLAKAVEMMDHGFNRAVYTRSLLSRIRPKITAKEKCFPNVIRYDRVRRARTFAEFDQEATAPLNGFSSAKEYWQKTSCRNYLERIQVDTLLIHAADDPFFPEKFLPWETFKTSEYIQLLTTRGGGHLGFVSGPWPWKQENWLEKTILDFFGPKRDAPHERIFSEIKR